LEIPSKCQILKGESLSGVKSVTVSKENPFFVIEDSFLKSYDRKRLISCIGSEKRVVVKKEVEVIERYCFYNCKSLREVVFEKGSELKEIRKCQAFGWTKVAKLEIPSKCQMLDVQSVWELKSLTISKENPFIVIEESFLKTSDGKRLIRYLGSEERVVVKKEVEVIGEDCFWNRESLREVVFEEESELKEIKDCAFSGTKVANLEIPSKCQILNGLSLNDVKSFTVSKENPFFVIEDSFLKSYDGKRLIWCMGSEYQVVVKKEVEVIGEKCFCYGDLREVIFEKPSKVQRFERKAFFGCDLRRMVIPASVEVIGEKCFSRCSSLCEVVYEGQVATVAENAFSGCPFWEHSAHV
jgi:hypothetical protein